VVTLKRVARMLEDTVNFIVKEGGWELWNVLSLGAPSHPFHIHLVRFQALQRVRYDASTFGKLPGGGFGTTVPVAPAGTASLDENEKGWKDTVRVGETANPTELSGELVTIAARFDGASGQYMYHCHILEHEDRSMMRPVLVLPASVIAMNPEMAHGHEH
jgi:spore coat protein A